MSEQCLLRVMGSGACAAVLALASCASQKPASRIEPAAASNETAPSESGAEKPRFELGEIGEPQLFGDAVALRVESHKNNQTTTRTLIVFAFLPVEGEYRYTARTSDGSRWISGSSGVLLTNLKIVDERQNDLSNTTGVIPEVMFSNSLYQTLDTTDRIIDRHGLDTKLRSPAIGYDTVLEHASEFEMLEVHLGWQSLSLMASSLSNNAVLKEMLTSAVQRPSWLSMALGVSVSIPCREGEQPRRTTYTLDDGITLPVYIVPMEIRLNDKPAMLFDLTVTSLRPPLALCGGVVSIDAWHPTKPDVRTTVRLAGASRGKPIEEIIVKAAPTPAANVPSPEAAPATAVPSDP